MDLKEDTIEMTGEWAAGEVDSWPLVLELWLLVVVWICCSRRVLGMGMRMGSRGEDPRYEGERCKSEFYKQVNTSRA